VRIKCSSSGRLGDDVDVGKKEKVRRVELKLARKTTDTRSSSSNEAKVSIPCMGCGTWSWGNRLLWGYENTLVGDEELRRVYDFLVDRGVDLFDAGDSYGTGKLEGQSEKLLGRFRSERRRSRRQGPENDDDAAVFATKLAAYPWRVTRGSWTAACRASSGRLQVDPVELVQLHWSAANYAPLQERALWSGLGDIAEQGMAKCIGVSNYGPKQLLKLHDYLAGRGLQLATCQVQFSLLSYDPLQRDVVSLCESLGIKVIAYSPLCLGILSGKYSSRNNNSLPSGLRGFAFRSLLPGARPLLRELEEVGDSLGATPAQVAVAWCMRKNTVPIPGAKTLAQAEGNYQAAHTVYSKLNRGHELALEQAANKCNKKMVQNIFQTK
jgi:pyridoxine 4-dehydrogenase